MGLHLSAAARKGLDPRVEPLFRAAPSHRPDIIRAWHDTDLAADVATGIMSSFRLDPARTPPASAVWSAMVSSAGGGDPVDTFSSNATRSSALAVAALARGMDAETTSGGDPVRAMAWSWCLNQDGPTSRCHTAWTKRDIGWMTAVLMGGGDEILAERTISHIRKHRGADGDVHRHGVATGLAGFMRTAKTAPASLHAICAGLRLDRTVLIDAAVGDAGPADAMRVLAAAARSLS